MLRHLASTCEKRKIRERSSPPSFLLPQSITGLSLKRTPRTVLFESKLSTTQITEWDNQEHSQSHQILYIASPGVVPERSRTPHKRSGMDHSYLKHTCSLEKKYKPDCTQREPKVELYAPLTAPKVFLLAVVHKAVKDVKHTLER